MHKKTTAISSISVGAERRSIIVKGPLNATPVQKACADARTKQHSNPTDLDELGFAAIAVTEPDTPETTEGELGQETDGSDACE